LAEIFLVFGIYFLAFWARGEAVFFDMRRHGKQRIPTGRQTKSDCKGKSEMRGFFAALRMTTCLDDGVFGWRVGF
jgi:hypothetical protein